MTGATVRSDLGGRDVTAALAAALRSEGHVFSTSSELELLRAVKEAACYVARSPAAEEAALRAERAGGGHSSSAPSSSSSSTASLSRPAAGGASYVLPDGTRLSLGAAAFRASEVLFQPSLAGLETLGAAEAAALAVARSDLDLRRELLAGVVLAGGGTAMRGFGERLLAELRRALPPDAHVKIWAPAERKVLAWVGGSILASLSTFRGMCVRREAWDEAGPAALARMG